MTDYRELLLGCGRSREKRVDPRGTIQPWVNLTTLDSRPEVEPDIVHDLDAHGNLRDIFDADTFDEVHAYEVLEHLGRQGSALEFFWHFFQIWSILKPGGFLCATVPSRYSEWLWGDPGHCRAIVNASLQFLRQPFYGQCDGDKPTPCSDYRDLWKGDFDVIRSSDDHTTHTFILQAVKPMRRAPYGK